MKGMEVKVAQSCPTLCNPMDYTVCGILQTRILEWVAFPFPEDLPNPGIEPGSPTLQTDSLPTKLRVCVCLKHEQLYVLYTVVCISQYQSPNLSLPSIILW